MKWFVAVACLVAVVEVSGKEWSKKTYMSKEKDKLALWESNKKPQFQKYQKAKDTMQKMKTKEPAVVDIEEGHRICKSHQEDSLPDFFVKFGVVTSFIEDVSAFKRSMKVSMAEDEEGDKSKTRSKRWRKKRLDSSGYASDKYFYKGKSGIGPKPVKNNHLYAKFRARSDRNNMPSCYGFNYLSAIDGLMQDGDLYTPDAGVLEEMLSELQDVDLSSKLTKLFEDCAEKTKDSRNVCPKVTPRKKKPVLVKGKDTDCSATVNNCSDDDDCAAGELCCADRCGGRVCYSPKLWAAKYRSDDGITRGGNRAAAKCGPADNFMQCVYENIYGRICTA